MKSLDRFVACCLLLICGLYSCAPGKVEAWPVIPGVYGLSPPPPTTTCPKGLTYVDFDGCNLAEATAQFQDQNLIATYALDATGNPQTIHHSPPFNVAGVDFPVGQTTTTGKEDPRDFTVLGTASFQTTTVTFTAIANGGVPKVGMYVWDRPSNGTAFFPTQNAPRISGACSGALPALVCPLDRTITARVANYVFASMWYGCVLQTAGTNWTTYFGGTGGSVQTYDQITCNFQNSTNGATAQISNITFGAVNGHPATLLVTTSRSDGLSSGSVVIDNSYVAPDAYTAGNYIISSSNGGPNVSLVLKNSECDGGNAGVPLLGPYNYSTWFGCVSWDSQGISSGPRNNVTLLNIYAHDWAANPFSTAAGYTNTTFQNVVAIRQSLNCGDVPPTNGCHGTLNAYGTTRTGSSGTLKMYNTTAVYPYGQGGGVITGAISIQGGIGAANSLEVEVKGATLLANTSNTAGISTAGYIGRVARVGQVSTLKLQHIYANSYGFAGCWYIGGDLQVNGGGSASMLLNSGLSTSVWTWSGLSSTKPLPYPGQTFSYGAGSGTPAWTATLTDLGDGTSRMDVTSVQVPQVGPLTGLTPGYQIVALRMASITQYPTTVVSGSGNGPYIVKNTSGVGETRANQPFRLAQAIMPFGSINPNTGLPTTATGGTNGANYNGTWLVGGERTQASSSQWATVSAGIGNIATLDADNHDLWMMNIAGSGGAWTLDGISLGDGLCPGVQPGN